LTTVLLLGSPLDAQRNALACMEIGGQEGYLLSPGCDLPYGTPPANLEAVYKVVSAPYRQAVVKAMATEETACDLMDLREYGQSDRVIVDIVTLDSEACAPCQYMVESVKAVTPEFEGIVEWREHKIKYRESLVFMTSLMVRNVPTICIDESSRSSRASLRGKNSSPRFRSVSTRNCGSRFSANTPRSAFWAMGEKTIKRLSKALNRRLRSWGRTWT
jgi:hypothetical protein